MGHRRESIDNPLLDFSSISVSKVCLPYSSYDEGPTFFNYSDLLNDTDALEAIQRIQTFGSKVDSKELLWRTLRFSHLNVDEKLCFLFINLIRFKFWLDTESMINLADECVVCPVRMPFYCKTGGLKLQGTERTAVLRCSSLRYPTVHLSCVRGLQCRILHSKF